jgi:hypothetical protein
MTHYYYYVGTALPPLKIGEQPDITFQEFDRLLRDNLSHSDYEQTKVLRRYYDILNIRAFLKKDPLDPYGNWDENDLDELLLSSEGAPPYLAQYLDKYESKEDRLKHFPELLAAFFREEVQDAEGFLKEYLTFERDLRLVLVGFRAKELKRDLITELQYENPDEDLVAQILSQKDAQTYEPPEKFEDLYPILTEHYQSPLELYQALCEYRFNKIDSMIGLETFSLERILGYMAQLIIVKKWLELDKQKGIQIVDNLIKESS